MEKDVSLGNVGQVSFAFADGKASVSGKVSADGGAVSASLSLSADIGVFVDQLEAAVEKALPASAPIDKAVFPALKALLLQVK